MVCTNVYKNVNIKLFLELGKRDFTVGLLCLNVIRHICAATRATLNAVFICFHETKATSSFHKRNEMVSPSCICVHKAIAMLHIRKDATNVSAEIDAFCNTRLCLKCDVRARSGLTWLRAGTCCEMLIHCKEFS